MAIKGLFIPVKGKPEVREYKNFEAFQKAVGGYVQVIPSYNGIMLIDEEAKIKGKAANALATHIQTGFLFRGDYIAGDAIIVGVVRNGEYTDVNPAQVEAYKNAENK